MIPSVPWWKPTDPTRVLLVEGATMVPLFLLVLTSPIRIASVNELIWILAGISAILIGAWAILVVLRSIKIPGSSHWLAVPACAWLPASLVYAMAAPNGRVVIMFFWLIVIAAYAAGGLRLLFVRFGWLVP